MTYPAGDPRSIDPFELFCAYHLGITPDDTYRASSLLDVARRFRVRPDTIEQALLHHAMDHESVKHSDFDLSLAQMDIQVSPAGVSKRELARNLYAEFRSASRGTLWNP